MIGSATTIVTALVNLGFTSGYVCNEVDGITFWDNPEPQPTNEELQAAGWVPATPPAADNEIG